MENLLIVLAVLAVALFVVVPLLEKTAKPIDPNDEEQQAQLLKKQKIIRFLMIFMALAVAIKYAFM